MVDGWLGFNDVGAREDEKENTSGTVGGNGAGAAVSLGTKGYKIQQYKGNIQFLTSKPETMRS